MMIHQTRNSIHLMKKITDPKDDLEILKSEPTYNLKSRFPSKENKVSPRIHRLNDSSLSRGHKNLLENENHHSLVSSPTMMHTKHIIYQNNNSNNMQINNRPCSTDRKRKNDKTGSILLSATDTSRDRIPLRDQEINILSSIPSTNEIPLKIPDMRSLLKSQSHLQIINLNNDNETKPIKKSIKFENNSNSKSSSNKAVIVRNNNSRENNENELLMISSGKTADTSQNNSRFKHNDLSPIDIDEIAGDQTLSSQKKSHLHMIKPITPIKTDILQKNFSLNMLTKSSVLNIISPNRIGRIDSSQRSDTKDHTINYDSGKNSLTSCKAKVPNYYHAFSKSDAQSNTINDTVLKKKLDFTNMKDSIEIEKSVKGILISEDKKSNYRQKSLIQNYLEKPIESSDISSIKINTQCNINEDRVQIGQLSTCPSMIIGNPTISKSSSKAVFNTEKNYEESRTLKSSQSEFINTVSQSKSPKSHDLSYINGNESAKKNLWMNTILDLKSKINDKEVIILELKNDVIKYNMENQTLLHEMKDLKAENHKLEETVEKLNQSNAAHEKEIDYLKKLKQKLETSFNEAIEAIQPSKIKKYESKIEEKTKEVKELTDKINQMLIEQKLLAETEKIQKQNELAKYDDLLKDKDAQIKKLEQEIFNNELHKKEYTSIEKKIIELEEMQNKLIEENKVLKFTLAEQVALIKEKEKEIEISDPTIFKDIITQQSATTKKLKDLEDLSKKLIKIFQSVIRGDEPPIDILLKLHKAFIKDKKINDTIKDNTNNIGTTNSNSNSNNVNNQAKLTAKHMTQQNHAIIESIYKYLMECIDTICSQYLQKYGSDCNLQQVNGSSKGEILVYI